MTKENREKKEEEKQKKKREEGNGGREPPSLGIVAISPRFGSIFFFKKN